MNAFKAEALSLEGTIEMIEKELPEALWGVGKCRCGDPEGLYAGTIYSADFQQVGFTLSASGLEPMVVGWSVHAHGSTHTEALGKAYGSAIEEGRS